jgi:hypothetical protein
MTTDRSSATDRDVGKPIVDGDGNRIGRVAGVTGNRIEVEPDPGTLDRIASRFGWDDRTDDTHRIDADAVRRVTDGEVILAD